MTKTFSKQVRFKEGDGFIHGFSTGSVKVKSKFRTAQGNVFTSKLNFLMDNEWTEYMPIMVWVIDHPEGVFVVDTGENAQVSQKDYFKKEGPILNYINTKSFAFEVQPEEEAGPGLQKLGYEQSAIKKVILTHLHLDHIDGLKYFEHSEILVNRLEWEKPSFALPSLYPKWFSPKTPKLDQKSDCFDNTLPLTVSKDIELVHTPGHTVGHISVLVKTNEMDFLLAGDVTYNQHQLEMDIQAGGHQSFKLSRNTYETIKTYASKKKLVYLPSHDNLALNRLMNDEYLKVK